MSETQYGICRYPRPYTKAKLRGDPLSWVQYRLGVHMHIDHDFYCSSDGEAWQGDCYGAV